MKLEKVWTLCYSATGNTERTVDTIGGELAAKLGLPLERIGFTKPLEREKEYTFTDRDIVVVGTPTYAGKMPNKLLPDFQTRLHGNGALAVAAVTFGNRNYDNSLADLCAGLEADGFRTVAAGAFVGEHSFSTILGAGRPDADDMALVDELAHKAAEKVKGLTQAPTQAVEVEGCDPIRPYYTPRDRHGEPIKDFLKAKPKTDPDKCVKCGLCARLCPMGSIDPNDVSNVVGKCIKCCACVKKCPKGAKYVDHEGYLYHQHELEDQYAGRRAPSKIFL